METIPGIGDRMNKIEKIRKISVVGIGPGTPAMLTAAARQALAESEVIVGYDLYVELIAEVTVGKTVLSTPMKKEVDRCRMALEHALEGHSVALVCSGDAGIYGMAGVMMEVAAEHPEIQIDVVAGVTAASSGAAVLGAPLGHDFAVISLSDLLTPWEIIVKRLRLAAEADFAICLYNPSSQKRGHYLREACGHLLQFKSPDTCCGYVRQIGRDGQSMTLCTLAELQHQTVDMFTTVFVGNSQSRVINGRLVTPRGYRGV